MTGPFKLLFLDFDGTATDAEREGTEPGPQSPGDLSFVDGYLKDIGVICDIPLAQMQKRNAALVAEMLADPRRHCLVIDGQKVAPSCVDPFLRTGMVVRLILEESGLMSETPETRAARDRMITSVIYPWNYRARSSICFRAGANALFAALRNSNIHIISNSHTDGVNGKLDRLKDGRWILNGDQGIPRVHGDAKKFINDPNWEGSDHIGWHPPTGLELPGLDREVLLRRRLYFAKMDAIRRHYGLEWGQIMVAGDIFELDLAVPLTLGCTVVLMANEFTPGYEIDFLQSHPNGHVIDKVMDIADLFLVP